MVIASHRWLVIGFSAYSQVFEMSSQALVNKWGSKLGRARQPPSQFSPTSIIEYSIMESKEIASTTRLRYYDRNQGEISADLGRDIIDFL
jgi:hypothetical protein